MGDDPLYWIEPVIQENCLYSHPDTRCDKCGCGRVKGLGIRDPTKEAVDQWGTCK